MTTTSLTWFYKTPEHNAYLLGERLRTSFWDARFGGVWLEAVRTESPFLMHGHYQDSDVDLEWEPGKWCTLRTNPARPDLAKGVSNLLGLKPAFTYETQQGQTVWEWLVGDTHDRWQAIQGKPQFGKLKRLN